VAVIEGGTSDGGEVTFVNGQAVEQTTEGESHEGTDRGDELAAAKAAVKKALEEDAKEEGKKAAKEAKTAREKDPLVPRDRNPDGTFVQQDPVEADKEAAVKALKAEKADEDKEASALRKALAERKEAAKYKKEASEALEKDRAEVRRVYERLQAQEKALKEQEERLNLYKRDPVRAIRELGGSSPEDFILDIAQEGTPEGQAKRAHRELLERLDRAEQWQKQELESRQKQAEERELHQKRAHRQQIEQNFLTEASRHESLVDMYKGYEVELIAQADIVAEKYRDATGKDASFAEIAEYLAERHEKWYKNRAGKNGATGLGQPSAAQAAAVISAGSPTQGVTPGKKRPTSTSGSERRSLGASFADLEGEERLEAAKTAVRAAIAASGDR
jgi:hypothetical protein